MIKPNFFIIGAPKCGTTSLFRWLSQHPQVFMPEKKEPNFFNHDFWVPNRISEAEYLKLFESAPPDKKVIGEASTRYLFSQVAIDNSLAYCNNPKFIAMVRNPVDMLYSLYNHLYCLKVEYCKSFRDAWNLKEARARGRSIKALCADPHSLAYGDIGRLGEQIERLYQKVPGRQRLVIVMDDLIVDPNSIWVSVLRFLNIDETVQIDFRVSNRSMDTRFKSLNEIVYWLSGLKRKFRVDTSFGILNRISQLNRVEATRQPLDDGLRSEIIQYFCDDILKLSNLLNRDLSCWLV
jgi:hypothetical protein